MRPKKNLRLTFMSVCCTAGFVHVLVLMEPDEGGPCSDMGWSSVCKTFLVEPGREGDTQDVSFAL